MMRALVKHELIRRSFLHFLAEVGKVVAPNEPFLLNWHHEAVAYAIEQLESGEIKSLVVTMPPRQAKSIMLSIALPAWLLGHDPTHKIICVTYADKLAIEMAILCRKVMQSDFYRAVFPKTILEGRAPADNLRTTAGGGRLATSVGGTITGRGGMTIIIDDPIKPVDARSATQRRNVINWSKDTILTRADNQDRVRRILVMQRLHEDDLAGHVLREGAWHHLNLAAVATEDGRVPIGPNRFYLRSKGVPIHPKRESPAAWSKLKKEMGDEEYETQCQQQPIPAGGKIFKRDWFNYYSEAPKRQHGDRIVQAWDTAGKDNYLSDNSVCVTALIRGREVYILHVYVRKMNFPDLLEQVKNLAREWQIGALLIEDAATGSGLIDVLKREKAVDIPTPIACSVRFDKETRAGNVTDRFRAGEIFFPEKAEWLTPFLQELLAFPKGRHDDQVDALVHLIDWSRPTYRPNPDNAGPELFDADDPADPWGSSHGTDDDDGWT